MKYVWVFGVLSALCSAYDIQLSDVCHNVLHGMIALKCMHNKQYTECAVCFPLYYYYCKYTCPCLLCCQQRFKDICKEFDHE